MDHSSTIVVSDSNSDIHTLFSPPINSHTDRDYELAMVNLETYYSFANIRDTNNCLKWKGKGDKEWRLVHVLVGCYELKDISEEICWLRGNTDLTFLPNVNTVQCIMTVVGTDLKVSFDTPSSLADVLGFEKNEVYRRKLHLGTLQYYPFVVYKRATYSCHLQLFSKCSTWSENTGITTQFNLSPSHCRRHFNDVVNVVDRPRRRALGSQR